MKTQFLRHSALAAFTAVAFGLAPLARAEDEAPMKPGSIPVSKESALASLAKISLTDAVKAALESNAGTAVAAKLEEDDGFLIWEVAIVSQGAKVEIDVDAGDGKILATEKADHEGEEKGEKKSKDEDHD